ncbi:MAG: helix-turn-helix domain-containing protein, partial [Flavobacteriales bacterium]
MTDILYFSVGVEAVIIFSCLIFIFLLMATEILPGKVFRFGLLLFLNLLFIALFYLFINLSWVNLALPLIWLFVPSTITVGLFFYRFNTDWLGVRSPIDSYINSIPWIILICVTSMEILNLILPGNTLIRELRVVLTESTMRFAFPVYNGLMIVLNLVKLKQAERINRESFSTDEVVNLNWSRISLLFFGLFYSGMIVSELVDETVSEVLFNSTLLLLTLYLGYFQIRTIARYVKITQVSEPTHVDGNMLAPDTPAQNSEDAARLNNLFMVLNELIDSELLYLKEDLTLYELGQRMELNPKYLSKAINFQEDLNFNKFVNQKRIRHAAEMIRNTYFDGLSLEGIAMESGFRSKSTFNTAFKTVMGCTPSE